jgi:hypothetical protein
VGILPKSIRDEYLKPYLDLDARLRDHQLEGDFNESDPNNYLLSIKIAVTQAINLLKCIDSRGEEACKEFVDHCKKWDQVYGLDAISIYPELREIFVKHGYQNI